MAFDSNNVRKKSAAVSNGNRKRGNWKMWLASARAYSLAYFKRAVLAPGSLFATSSDAADDQFRLLKLHASHGPIAKAWIGGKVTTCIFSIEKGRKFLAENDHRIEGATADYTSLFAHGTLRQMTRSTHRKYRRVFAEAMRGVNLMHHDLANREIVDRMTASLIEQRQPLTGEAIRRTLKQAVTEMLFRMALGIGRDWNGFEELVADYERFAPDGADISLKSHHALVFADMARKVRARSAELTHQNDFHSLHGQLAAGTGVDETIAGNLLHMTEVARYDMMSLWLWIVRLLGDQQELLDRISSIVDDTERKVLCRAVAMETLRLEQSEYIARRALEDIVFEGYFIPRRTIVRVAIWEAHKDPTSFAEPFRFDPSRFVDTKVLADRYAPLGMGKHHCLGAEWVFGLSALLIERMAAGCRWTLSGDAGASRGRFHFQPSASLEVYFRNRTEKSAGTAS
jgi:cytochrome P450